MTSKHYMTKTIVIGACYQDDNKPIEFNYYLDGILCTATLDSTPSNFKYVELICKKYNGGMDLMFAYNDPSNRSNGILYMGFWNSGVVK